MRFLSFLRGYEPGLPRAVRERQSDGWGGVRAVLPRVRRTMPTTNGAVASWPCPIETPGQIDWSGTVTAPGSRAESAAGGRDLAGQLAERGRAPAVARHQQHVARMVLIGAGDGGLAGQCAHRGGDAARHDDQGQDGHEQLAPAAQAAPPGDRRHSPMVRRPAARVQPGGS